MSVIARKGLEQATMQEIADEAGIAKGTLYVYFKDRDALLAKTADRAFDRLVAELDAAFRSAGSLEERLMAVVSRQLRFFDENRELFRAAMALSHRDPAAPLRKPRTGAYGRYLQRIETMFTEAKERGEIRDLDPRDVAAVYSDCIRGVIIRRMEEKTKSAREEQAAFIVSILLRGIQGDTR